MYKIGDQVLVRFPQEETGKKRKLSKPWHGPYRITQTSDPDVTVVVPVHYSESGTILVHQSRVCLCPPKWPTAFYWYGGNKLSRGKVPKWLENLLAQGPAQPVEEIVPTEDDIQPAEDDNEQSGELNYTEAICDLNEDEPASTENTRDDEVCQY